MRLRFKNLNNKTMELTGKVIEILPVETGKGKNNKEWEKRSFVIETLDKYPNKVCFSLWGDKVGVIDGEMGAEVVVHYDASSREYKGRWYTELKCWKLDIAGLGDEEKAAVNSGKKEDMPQDTSTDLPF